MSMNIASLSVTALNQFVLDFKNNYERIVRSVEKAKRQGSRFRCGPELDVTGYSCQDHFFEQDTITHSWEVLAKLLTHEKCQDILMDVGMPVCHRGVNYNCKIIFLNRKIYFIRAKLILANDFNYREHRWFTAWLKPNYVEQYKLPDIITEITGQKFVPIGDAILALHDTKIGYEICEELWNPQSPHVALALAGAEVIINPSGSHSEIRKAYYALDLMKTASCKSCSVYAFSNLRGCDGERYYLNGLPAVAMNGNFLKMGDHYSLQDVEVLTVHFNYDEIRASRATFRSRSLMASKTEEYKSVDIPWSLSAENRNLCITPPILCHKFLTPEEEISKGPALWLWDYLRRSKASGFLLPLSGGVDSSSVAIIVYSMCCMVVNHICCGEDEDNKTLIDLRNILRKENYMVSTAKDLCKLLLYTCYMKSDNSSEETELRAEKLAAAIGSNHRSLNISPTCKVMEDEVSKCLGKRPSFSGTSSENLALQNVQARSRMVFAYMLAQLGPWSVDTEGFLLVLGAANVDEALCGYFTKYDCSAADINPIGGISKNDLKTFIIYAMKEFDLKEVNEIVEAVPTAELQPLEVNQSDEEDLGMSYSELSVFGQIRRPLGCGPLSMFTTLCGKWPGMPAKEIARKVKHFYAKYASNRHKMSILTPSCHMENYSPEDHRHDLRPLIYPVDFTWQFQRIDELASTLT